MITTKTRKGGRVAHLVYIQANGSKKYVGSFDSAREAKEQEQEAIVTQRKIERGELAPELDVKRTFGAGVAEWLASLEAQASRSVSIYRRRMKGYILPTLGTLSLPQITPAAISRLRDNISHAVSSTTVNATLGAISTAFEYFIAMRWTDTNPTRGVPRLEEQQHAFEWLRNGEQITRLLAACSSSIRPIIALLVGTGMRLDEALHLRWDDVDVEHRLIHVRRGRQGTTKSGKARPVPIFDAVLPLLRELRLQRGDNELVFAGKVDPITREMRARSKTGVFVPFKKAVKDAGLPPKLRPHDLRHSFAILYLLDGGDLHRLSRMLGHSTVITTERYYLRFKPVGFDLDYGRVAFAMPSEAKVIELRCTGTLRVPVLVSPPPLGVGVDHAVVRASADVCGRP